MFTTPEQLQATVEAGAMPTAQQTFDAVATHLSRMQRRSVRPVGFGPAPSVVCVYRAPDGGKCAIGGLIPDSVYRAWMDGEFTCNGVHAGGSVTGLMDRQQIIETTPGLGYDPMPTHWVQFMDHHRGLLSELQDVHDVASDDTPRVFHMFVATELKDVALTFSLDTAVLYLFGYSAVHTEPTETADQPRELELA